jgi:hypothetical protein
MSYSSKKFNGNNKQEETVDVISRHLTNNEYVQQSTLDDLIGDNAVGIQTLGLLSDALNDDSNFSATVTTALGQKIASSSVIPSNAMLIGFDNTRTISDSSITAPNGNLVLTNGKYLQTENIRGSNSTNSIINLTGTTTNTLHSNVNLKLDAPVVRIEDRLWFDNPNTASLATTQDDADLRLITQTNTLNNDKIILTTSTLDFEAPVINLKGTSSLLTSVGPLTIQNASSVIIDTPDFLCNGITATPANIRILDVDGNSRFGVSTADGVISSFGDWVHRRNLTIRTSNGATETFKVENGTGQTLIGGELLLNSNSLKFNNDAVILNTNENKEVKIQTTGTGSKLILDSPRIDIEGDLYMDTNHTINFSAFDGYINNNLENGSILLRNTVNTSTSSFIKLISNRFETYDCATFGMGITALNPDGNGQVIIGGFTTSKINSEGPLTIQPPTGDDLTLKTIGVSSLKMDSPSIEVAQSATQKIGLFGVTPVVQPATGGAGATTFVGGSGVNLKRDSTFDGWTLGQVITQLKLLGILGA